MKQLTSIFVFLFSLGTALVGHAIHHSFFWSVCDFFFSVLAWAKWLIFQEVTLNIIKSAFSFFWR